MCPTDFVFNWSQRELHFHFSEPIFHRTVLKSDDRGRKCEWVIKIWVAVNEMTACIQTNSSLWSLAELSKPSNKNLYRVLEGEQQNLTKLRLLPTHASGNRSEGFFPLKNHTRQIHRAKILRLLLIQVFYHSITITITNSASKTTVRTWMTAEACSAWLLCLTCREHIYRVWTGP